MSSSANISTDDVYVTSLRQSVETETSNTNNNSCNTSLSSDTASRPQFDEEERCSEQYRKLFVGGLTPIVTDGMLRDFFIEFGDITDVVVMKDNKSGRSRGFGFVTFREPEMVDAAQDARPHIIDDKEVETKRAMPREDSDKPEAHMTVKKLFVGALKKDVTSQDLQIYFSDYGNIEECEVMTWKETGESRGFGFVTFDDYDPVDKSILYKPHQIKTSKVDVKKALSKEEMAKVKAKQEQHQDNLTFSPITAMQLQLQANMVAAGQFQGPTYNPYQIHQSKNASPTISQGGAIQPPTPFATYPFAPPPPQYHPGFPYMSQGYVDGLTAYATPYSQASYHPATSPMQQRPVQFHGAACPCASPCCGTCSTACQPCCGANSMSIIN